MAKQSEKAQRGIDAYARRQGFAAAHVKWGVLNGAY